MGHARTILSLLLLTAAGTAQTTWTVAGDGSAQFTQIEAAYDAASPGDTVLVRPGTYQGFERWSTKGLRILGSAPGVVIDGPLRLRNVPNGQQLAIHHLTVDATNNPFVAGVGQAVGMVVEGCSNLVLSDLVVRAPRAGVLMSCQAGVGLAMTNVTGVLSRVAAYGNHATGCGTSGQAGGSGCELYASRVALSACTFQAGDSSAGVPNTPQTGPALACVGGVVVADECTFVPGLPSGIAVTSSASRVLLAHHVGAPIQVARQSTTGAIEFEGAVTAGSGSLPLTARAQPGLVGPATVATGSTLAWDVYGGAGQVCATVVSLGSIPWQFPSLFDGTVFPALHPSAVLGVATIGASGSTTTTLAVPSVASLVGTQVYLQCAGWLGQSRLKATGVAVTTIR